MTIPDDSPTPEAVAKVRKLFELYLAGALPGPEQHEVHPDLPRGSRENYLYFTLPCTLNFQRNSPALWRSALATYEDPATNYLFFPEMVVARARDEVAKDLLKHRLGLQTHRHPSIWLRLCETFAAHYQSDPRRLLSENGYDVVRIIRTLQVTRRDLFPYLGGIKLSNYWLFILSRFTDVPLENVAEISIIPDTHVIRATIHLGLAGEGVTPSQVELMWRRVSEQVGVRPSDLHSALWRWSRNHFRPNLDT